MMTFIITDNNVVNEKDLGANTAARASAVAASQNGSGWIASDDK